VDAVTGPSAGVRTVVDAVTKPSAQGREGEKSGSVLTSSCGSCCNLSTDVLPI
jgi:hypothetical protein